MFELKNFKAPERFKIPDFYKDKMYEYSNKAENINKTLEDYAEKVTENSYTNELKNNYEENYNFFKSDLIKSFEEYEKKLNEIFQKNKNYYNEKKEKIKELDDFFPKLINIDDLTKEQTK